jgi:hypothetical protein
MAEAVSPIRSRSRLTVYNMNVNASATSEPPRCLRLHIPRRPSFDPPQHPHCRQPDDPVHPSFHVARTSTIGNDNSSLTRQLRNHSSKPDPVPGTQYAGVCYQKMGHVLLGTYRHAPGTVTYDGRLSYDSRPQSHGSRALSTVEWSTNNSLSCQ